MSQYRATDCLSVNIFSCVEYFFPEFFAFISEKKGI